MRTSRALDPAVFAEARARGLSPMMARVIAGRIGAETDLDVLLEPRLSNIPPPNGLADIEPALARLIQAITTEEPIGILTDYDADGLTSHAVLNHALLRFGVRAEQISHWIGHRLEEGYGISPLLVDRILQSTTRPALLISADCGSSDETQIARLKAEGIDVVVTDHHRVSDTGPPASAFAVVNPNRADCAYPDKAIAGCMVSWLVMSALRGRLVEAQVIPADTAKLGDLLDYVALGTVADCVSLGASEINRAVVRAGLKYIAQASRPCWAVALQKLTRSERDVSASLLAFQIAPRLNARGRIDHSMRGFEFLVAETADEASAAYADLDRDNFTRRQIEKQMVEHAKPLAERQALRHTKTVVVAIEDGHAGVQGIVASRLVEATGRPAIVLTPGLHENTLTGSMRSIPGVDAKALLDAVAAATPEVLIRYGGHVGACGMTIVRDQLKTFHAGLETAFETQYPESPAHVRYLTDGTLLAEDFQLDRVEALDCIAPFGRGFEEPLFEGVFEVIRATVIGGDGTHLRLRLKTEQAEVDAVWFGSQPSGQTAAAIAGDWLDCVYHLTINTYRGLEVSLTIRHGEVITEGMQHV
jgi:single-stranded-DNA-specific exonuclease